MPVAPDSWTPGGPLTADKLTAEYADRPLGTRRHPAPARVDRLGAGLRSHPVGVPDPGGVGA